MEGEEAEAEGKEEEEEEDATTPKVDMGKRKPEMVLSPKTFMMGEPERGREGEEKGRIFG